MWIFGKETKADNAEDSRRAIACLYMSAAVSQNSMPIMMVDRALKVTFVNTEMRRFLKKFAEDLALPDQSFAPDRIVGSSIGGLSCGEVLHDVLRAPANMPVTVPVTLGTSNIPVHFAAVNDPENGVIGFVLEWHQKENDELVAKLDVLDKVQNVIEFNPDATVITANKNFLKLFGYTLEEVVGQHNDMFIDDVTKQSEGYRKLWDGLARGESHLIKTKVVARDGSDMWLSVSYNAVTNEAGETVRIIAFVTDITESEKENNENKAVLDAMHRAQAVVEFGLDSTVQDANPNFLKIVGYTKQEAVGLKHKDFVPPEYATTDQYKQNWDKLRRGELVVGKFLRMGKGGRKIWMEATYNPILDLDGKPYKIVKFASDVTAAETEHQKVEEERQRMSDELAFAIRELEAHLKRVSAGDLTSRLEHAFAERYESLRRDFNATVDKLQKTMQSVTDASSTIRAGSGEISSAAEDLSHRTEQQAASLEETAAALEEITATVKKTASNATHASSIVATAKGAAEEGGIVVERVISAMSNIEQSSKQITDIIGVIDEIAFQTNLLALNAGVEAARAGEAGRGFAVVASEVRALAQRSSEASREIKSLIKTSSIHVADGVKLTGESGEALSKIVSQVVEINSLVTEMAQAAQQQSTGIEEVNAAVSQMDQVTQQNAAMVEESTAASRSLVEKTKELMEQVAFFKTGSAVTAARPAVKTEEPPKPAAKPAPMPEVVAKTAQKPAPKPAAVEKAAPKPVPKPEPKAELKPAPKPAPKPVPKPVPKPAPKPVPRPAAKPDTSGAGAHHESPAVTAKRIVGGGGGAQEDDWEEF